MSYRRRLRSLFLYLCYVFRALINSLYVDSARAPWASFCFRFITIFVFLSLHIPPSHPQWQQLLFYRRSRRVLVTVDFMKWRQLPKWNCCFSLSHRVKTTMHDVCMKIDNTLITKTQKTPWVQRHKISSVAFFLLFHAGLHTNQRGTTDVAWTEGGELDPHEEVRLSFAGSRRDQEDPQVVLDPQESPGKIKSREVELGSEM